MALPCSSAGGEGVWGERLVFCQTETPTLPAGNWGGRSRECRTHNVRLLPPLLGSLLCSGQPRSPERQRSRCREQVQCDGSPPWPALPLPCSPPPTTTATPPQPHSLTRPAQPLLGCMARVPGTCGCTHTTLASVLLSLFEPHSNPGSPWHCTPGSAPSLLLRTAEIRRVPIRVGSCTAFTSIQLEPSPSHLPRTPCPPHPVPPGCAAPRYLPPCSSPGARGALAPGTGSLLGGRQQAAASMVAGNSVFSNTADPWQGHLYSPALAHDSQILWGRGKGRGVRDWGWGDRSPQGVKFVPVV